MKFKSILIATFLIIIMILTVIDIPKGVIYYVVISLQVIIPIIITIMLYKLWKKYGKDNEFIESIEYYPPAGLNSAEIGFFYKGYANNKDVISLLLYLGNKGYLKIVQEGQRTTKDSDFKIIKLKEYDGNNENERIFFEDLFTEKNEVNKKDLFCKYYATLKAISQNMNVAENEEKIFEKQSLKKRLIIVGVFFIIFVLMNGLDIFKVTSIVSSIEGVILLFVALAVLIFLIYKVPDRDTVICASICFLAITMFGNFADILENKLYILKYIIQGVCLISSMIFLVIIRKRTTYGNEMLRKVSGLKKFIEEAESNQIETLIKRDPNYFYNILPYAYALGVTNKWIKKFKEIEIHPAKWHSGYEYFDNDTFKKFMNTTYYSIASTMEANPIIENLGKYRG